MRCPACGADALPGSNGTCTRCGATLTGLDAPTIPPLDTSAASATTPVRAAAPPAPGTGLFSPGTAFGGRYHVIRLLGAGGMGAVYQAWDNELAVAVALKVIRPEVMIDPDGARDLERRFKRELLLARQVTHKNVVRIHDLGEIDGIKYITMPYIQGTDLASRLHREGKLPVSKVLAIARQVAQGLAAAHEAGVVHRDLKPANIMIDEEDRAIIMDFGIARSTSAGATLLGTVVGTLEYMAPEQAMGQPVDHRADIYAFGLILRDLVIGRRSAARAESAVAELMNRMQRMLPPIRSVDPSISEPVEQIISTCTEPDPAARFQTTVELIAALENLDSEGHLIDPARRDSTSRRHSRSTFPFPTQPMPAAAAPRWGALTPVRAAMVAVIILAIGAPTYYLLRDDSLPAATAEETAASAQLPSLAVLPFRNQTGDASLDWMGGAVAEMLKGAVPQSRIRAVSSDRVFQVLRDLRVSPDTSLDSGTMRRLSEFSNARIILAGRYVKAGDELRLEAVLRDVQRGVSDNLSATMVNQRQLMDAVAILSRAVEEKLFIDSPLATSGVVPARPSTQSMEALQFFSEGVELGRRGNHLEAARKFEAAVKADAAFALAHARLAQTYATLGRDTDAERASSRAVEHATDLPDRERYEVDATRARVLNDHERAIAAYQNLLRISPDDPQVHFNLAGRFEATGAFDRAQLHYRKVVEADPKYFDALFAAGRVEVLRKSPENALDYFSRALNVAIAVDNDEGRASALNATGIAYKRLNKLEDARRFYSEALEIRRRIGDKRGMASTLSELAQVQDDLGRPTDALQSYQSSLQLRREIGDKRGLATGLNNLGTLYQSLGRLDEALTHYKEALQLQTDLGNADYQGLALHNIGDTLTELAQYDDAASYLSRALQIREKLKVPVATAQTLRSLGELHVRTGQYDQALSHYLKAIELCREAADARGAALASGGTALVFEEQGRYRAALDAARDAVEGLRGAKESGVLFVEALANHAHAWSLVARSDEAQTLFQQSLETARKLANARVSAHATNLQGEEALLAGKGAEANAILAQAVQHAVSSNDRYLVLRVRLNVAKAQLQLGRAQPAHAGATAVGTEATRLGLKHLAADASLTAGEALMLQKAHAKAQSALETALRAAERIGARPLMARAHYAMATSLSLAGQPAAADAHYRDASRLLDELQAGAGADSLMKRADLSGIAAAAQRRSPAPN